MTIHHQREIQLGGHGPGLTDVTTEIAAVARDSGVNCGLVTCFIRHTSASLVIQENADPDVQRDLQAFFARLVPEGDPLYRHTDEGLDDMPAHVKCAITATSLTIPLQGGKMVLGTWQGIYLWEHRRKANRRKVVVHVHGLPR
jgi:secondary thiamine-phosphate synthase enzyme